MDLFDLKLIKTNAVSLILTVPNGINGNIIFTIVPSEHIYRIKKGDKRSFIGPNQEIVTETRDVYEIHTLYKQGEKEYDLKEMVVGNPGQVSKFLVIMINRINEDLDSELGLRRVYPREIYELL